MPTDISARARLRDIIDSAFSLGELRDLCLDLNEDYDNLPGENKKGKAGALVERFVRKGRPEQLVQRILALRDNLTPADVPIPEPERDPEQPATVVVVSGEGRRYACVIGANEYDNPALPALPYPETNVDELARALKDKRRGAFDTVVVLTGKTSTEVNGEIKRICGQLKVDDLLLLYFTGYALLDEEETGKLFFAAANTDPTDLPGSGIDFARLNKNFLDKSAAAQKLIIVDCQYGGQPGPAQVRDPAAFVAQLREPARGKYLISNAVAQTSSSAFGAVVPQTSSSASSAEHGSPLRSPLTQHLLDGLTSGQADLDQSGKITVDEWFTYAQRQMADRGLPPPLQFTEGVAGNWVIARTPGSGAEAATVVSPNLRRNYKQIGEMLRDGELIPFLGSGVVMDTWPPEAVEAAGPSAELPFEWTLAQRIAARTELPDAERCQSLTAIAQHYQSYVIGGNRQRFYEKLKKLLPADVQPGPVHEFLAQQAQPMLIVSACYDTLLEQAFQAQGKKYAVVTHVTHDEYAEHSGHVVVQYSERPEDTAICLAEELIAKLNLAERSVIYKIQGMFDLFVKRQGGPEEVDSLLITENDYVDFLGRLGEQNRTIPTLFARPFQQRTFLFLGYALNDWNSRTVAQMLRKDHKLRQIKDYAVRTGATTFEQQVWESEKIQVIDQDVAEFVAGLADEMGRNNG